MLPVKTSGARVLFDTPFDALARELDRAFGGVSQAVPLWANSYPVDIREDENHVHIEAELPGFTRDQIEVTIENGELTISAERKPEAKPGHRHLAERRHTRMARKFSLPNTLDPATIAANLADGVLTVSLTKRAEVRPQRVEIK